jgi:hypothetical protein
MTPNMRHITLAIALVAVAGCSGQLNETSSFEAGNGNADSGDAGTGATDNGEAGNGTTGNDASGDAKDASADVIAPVACATTSVDAGASSMSDAGVPFNHRPAPACCPAQRGPAPAGQPYPTCSMVPGSVCPSEFATTCKSDSDCTAGATGRCFPDEGLVGPGGCSYDECFTDSQCGSKIPCVCRTSSADTNANVCDVGGNCAVDSDCGSGGYCSPSPQIGQYGPNQTVNVCWGSKPYFCHTASDLCVNDSDCASLDAGANLVSPPLPPWTCAYDAQDSRWECVRSACLLP